MEKDRSHPVDRALPPKDAKIEDTDSLDISLERLRLLSGIEMFVSFPKHPKK